MESKNFFKNKENGAAMLVVVIFFLIISMVVISGLVPSSVREIKSVSQNLNSKKSYFLAESGIEDAVYRISTNKTIGASETISLDSNSVTTLINSIGNSEKSISSTGDVLNYKRKLNLSLQLRNGTVFKYGSQAGKGGIIMSNNAGINGSIYSNGDIIGSNGSFIKGDAFVADPPAFYTIQSNGETGTPPYDIPIGKLTTTQDFAQSFQVNESTKVTKFQFYIKKIGSPSYNPYVYIYTDDNGKPKGYGPIIGGQAYSNTITGYYNWVDIGPFNSTFILMPGVTYWLVVDCSSVSSTNYYSIAGNQTFQNGDGLSGQKGGSWANTNPVGLDMYFKLFSGGTHGIISNVKIGDSVTNLGDANVYTLEDSTVYGTAYCKEGSGNNKTCNTSKNIPTEEPMPISDAMINNWKADALSGGTTEGDQNISGTQTLGPRKINGNLVISDTLNLSNTLWVTGNLTINGRVKLNSSYGATTGIIIVDGYTYVANNSIFKDSGTVGSYIMLLSTSNCDASAGGNPCGAYSAIDVRNNSSLVIANAQKGGITFQNNAGVKEVVANRIYLANNATVSYGSGLLNVDFTSGDSGAWVINDWKETQ